MREKEEEPGPEGFPAAARTSSEDQRKPPESSKQEANRSDSVSKLPGS